jgi:hypothetical protein
MKMNNYIKITCLFGMAFLWAACNKEAEMTGITVDKESLSLQLGDHAQITVQPVPENVSVDTRTYEWSSDNEAIATVTRFGIVHTVEEGTCNITVKHGAFSKTVPVTITDPIVVPDKIAHWKFENAADLTEATIGNPLVYGKGAGTGLDMPTTDLSGFTPIDGPKSDNKAVRIAKGYFFGAAHGLTTPVTVYTLMIDFKIPAIGSWHTFYQTDQTNGNDGEVFINTSGAIGVGATGYSDTKVTAGEWHRFVVSCKLGEALNYYLDGALIKTSSTADDRFALAANILLLGDNDGDDGDIDVSEIAMWQEALDANQVKKLERTESKLR